MPYKLYSVRNIEIELIIVTENNKTTIIISLMQLLVVPNAGN